MLSYTRIEKIIGDSDSDFYGKLVGELVDLKYGPELGYRYQSSVETRLGVDIRFSRPVAIVDESGTRLSDELSGTWDDLPDIAVLGEDPVDADVTFSGADFLLNEQGAITISDYLEFNALSLEATLKVGPLPVPVLSLGPVVHARTSVLEHIDFPEIPEPPQTGPDPFATIRATKVVFDAIGEIPIFENRDTPLTSIQWEEGEQPTTQFTLQPQPSEIVFISEDGGFERLSDGSGVWPNSQSKLIFGKAAPGKTVESEADLTAASYRTSSDGSRFTAQTVTIPEGSVFLGRSENSWTTNRFVNHGEYSSGRTSRFSDAGSGILTIGGTSSIDFANGQRAIVNANIFIHEAGHTMRFGDTDRGLYGHEFNVKQSFENHGTIVIAGRAKELKPSEGFTNTGVFQVANSSFNVDAPVAMNDGLIEVACCIAGRRRPGQLILEGDTLSGSGEWLARDGGKITFHNKQIVGDTANAPLTFAVRRDGEMKFVSTKLQVLGTAEFYVGEGGTLTLSALNPDEESDVSFVNHGIINIDGDVSIGGGMMPGEILLPSLVPIDLENTGTIRIRPSGSLRFDARIENYAEGGASFDVGTWELKGDPVRWDNTDESTIPSTKRKSILNVNVVGIGDGSSLDTVNFDGDPNYDVDDFDTAMRINASNVTLSGAAVFPYFNTVEENSGNIRLEKGIRFQTVGSLTSTGDIEVGAYSALGVNGDLRLHGGKLSVEPPEPGGTGDFGKYPGFLNVVGRSVEVVGAELSLAEGTGRSTISLVGGATIGRHSNRLVGDWLVQESSRTDPDGTVTVTGSKVTGVGGPWGIEELSGFVTLDGRDVEFESLGSLRSISFGELKITGGHEYHNTAADEEFNDVPAKSLRVQHHGTLTIEHSGSMYAHSIEAHGDVRIGSNGSLSLKDEVLRKDSRPILVARNASQVLVDGVLHAHRVVVENGATLEGNGRIASNVEIQRGLLQPGDDEGLRIFGDPGCYLTISSGQRRCSGTFTG